MSISASDVASDIPLSGTIVKNQAAAPGVMDQVNGVLGLQGKVLNNKLVGNQVTHSGYENESARQDVVQKKITAAGDLALSLINGSSKYPLTGNNINEAIKTGLFDTGIVRMNDPSDMAAVSAWTRPLKPGNTPEEQAWNKTVLIHLYQQTHPGAEGINAVSGSPQTVNTGPAQLVGRGPGADNPGFQAGSTVLNALSPQDKIQQAPSTQDPDTGQVHPHLMGEVVDAYGNLLPPGGAPPQAGGTSGSPAPPPPNGRYPGAHLPPSTLGAGQLDILADSAKTYNEDIKQMPNLQRTMTTFKQGLQALRAAKTGPGSDALQNMRGIADTFGLPLPVLSNKDETVAYAEADKWLTSALSQEASRLGMGTDQARELQSRAQPGVHTVRDAAIAMVPVLKGLKAMEMAAPVLFKATKLPSQQYTQWRADWAKSVNPIAFGADLMTLAERKEMRNKMSGAEQKAFAESARQAIAAGLYTKDDLLR